MTSTTGDTINRMLIYIKQSPVQSNWQQLYVTPIGCYTNNRAILNGLVYEIQIIQWHSIAFTPLPLAYMSDNVTETITVQRNIILTRDNHRDTPLRRDQENSPGQLYQQMAPLATLLHHVSNIRITMHYQISNTEWAIELQINTATVNIHHK